MEQLDLFIPSKEDSLLHLLKLVCSSAWLLSAQIPRCLELAFPLLFADLKADWKDWDQ